VLSTVYATAQECQYMYVDFDAEFEGTLPTRTSTALHAEPAEDLMWHPCDDQQANAAAVATLTSTGTAVGAAIEDPGPSPEDCMDTVTSAALNIEYLVMDDSKPGLSAGTSLCIWNEETSRLTIASSERMEHDDNSEYVVDYRVSTYLQQ